MLGKRATGGVYSHWIRWRYVGSKYIHPGWTLFVICHVNGMLTLISTASPLSMGWATITIAKDAEERAAVTANMNALGQAMAVWDTDLSVSGYFCPELSNRIYLESGHYCRTIPEYRIDS
jgi:hypothetical protein